MHIITLERMLFMDLAYGIDLEVSIRLWAE